VDKRTYRTEENHESSKKTIPKNKRQCRTKREKQSDKIEIKIRSDNIKTKKQIMERILQFNNRSQPLERGIQTGSRKEEKQHTDKTLRKPDGSLTKDTKETLRLMLEYFTPEDNELEDNDYHKQVRDKTTRPPNTPDDCEFTIDEIRRVIEGMDTRAKTGSRLKYSNKHSK
jgi:hypothetical protein